MSSVPHHPAPPPLPASAVKMEFSGDRGQFRRLVARGTGLELITFGFYRFWLATDIRRHLWSHTSLHGDAPEYTGRGRELLIGFLFAMAILVPIYLAYFLIGIEAERYKAFASFPLFLFFYLFGQFAIYRARRYRLTRTVWRGVRFWMDGSGWAYAVRAFAWALLAAVTLGGALPWREAALERYKMRHCHYGDLPGSFEGRGSELFKRGWKFWLMMLSPLIAGLAIAVVNAGHKMSAAESRVLGLVILIWMIALPFIYGAFKAVEWRWWISGIRFGDVSFESDLSGHDLYGLYWKVIGWFFLLLLLFVIFAVACSFWIFGFGDLSHLAARLHASVAMTVALVIGYLGFILAMNVVLRIYLLRDVWARVSASATCFRLEAAGNVAAKGELADALGEGFAGGLDVVGF
ncbi:MAG TPA: DUF898 family protein [Bradyrhizobium sp.]|uniref:DUF898 family protein n=1 Tax=Bradyrhizobium sp. TaxID=376 RepID=UPI002D7FF4BE|nr:DUF898 family protein [Bradyrhizobium sp.]HET7887979.1 DUF898 family protein [Bradyrhizobium sp.]